MASPPGLSRRQAWWLAVRPFSLPASIVPVLVGTAVAATDNFNVGLFILTLAGSVLIQAATNLATDFFDYADGVQPQASLGGVIRGGYISAQAVHRGALLLFGLGSICGLIIVIFTGWPILAAGFASVLAGYFYTGAPIAYGRKGLGEVMVFVFMGLLMVMATYYVQVEKLSWSSFYAALPVGILVFNILHANNLRDIDNDRSRRKVTIATAIGRPMADYMLIALVSGAFVMVGVCAALGAMPLTALVVGFALPDALRVLRVLSRKEAPSLNPLVRGAAELHLHFGVLLTLGYLLDLL